MVIFHNPNCVNYHRSGDPERPARITTTVPLLKERHPSWTWIEPPAATDEQLLRTHTLEHLQRVANPERDFDLDTPAHEHIDTFARSAAGAAIAAAAAALKGERSFSLMRPPGHHATRDRAMGFCYFSNVAVAALDAIDAGVEKVAIWDFDAHHGNGTEDIVRDKTAIAFASIHQSPGYPGTGLRSFDRVYNFPVPPYTGRKAHMLAIEQALQKLRQFKPGLLLVSAGFDACVDDPITHMTLELKDFAMLGRWLTDLDIPTAAILEGGYSDDLPQLIDAFLASWDYSK
jgi:acetoin utilization deacetylase AcuC-like enzyme